MQLKILISTPKDQAKGFGNDPIYKLLLLGRSKIIETKVNKNNDKLVWIVEAKGSQFDGIMQRVSLFKATCLAVINNRAFGFMTKMTHDQKQKLKEMMQNTMVMVIKLTEWEEISHEFA